MDEVYMRFNNPRARWEPLGSAWDWTAAILVYGKSYDLKLVCGTNETIRLKSGAIKDKPDSNESADHDTRSPDQ